MPLPVGIERECREGLAHAPAVRDPDFGPVAGLIESGEATAADVRSALADVDRKKAKLRSWITFAGWVRGAAKDRVAAAARSRAGPSAGKERRPSGVDLYAEIAANPPPGRDDSGREKERWA